MSAILSAGMVLSAILFGLSVTVVSHRSEKHGWALTALSLLLGAVCYNLMGGGA